MNTCKFFLITICIIFKVSQSTDTYLNFTTGINLNSGVKQVLKRWVNGSQRTYILFMNATICYYDDQFRYLGNIDTSLRGRNLTNLLIAEYNNELFYMGITYGGNQFYVLSNYNKSYFYSIPFTNLKFIAIQYANRLGDLVYVAHHEDMVELRNTTFVQSSYNLSVNFSEKNQISKVLYYSDNSGQYNIILTSLKYVYYLQYWCTTSTSCSFTNLKLIQNLSTISSFSVVKYTLDVAGIVLVQFSDGKFYSFFHNGYSAPIYVSSLQAQTGSSVLNAIVFQNASPTFQRVFAFSDKSLRGRSECFSGNSGQTSYCNFTYKSISQSNFPVTNWTALAEFNQSQGFVFTKGSPNIFGYCFTTTTGATLSSCKSSISCSLSNCYICNVTKLLCVTCSSNYQVYQGVCYPIKACLVLGCEVCSSNQTCVKCLTNFYLDVSANTCVSQTILVPSNNTNNSSNSSANSGTANSTGNTTSNSTGNTTASSTGNTTGSQPGNITKNSSSSIPNANSASNMAGNTSLAGNTTVQNQNKTQNSDKNNTTSKTQNSTLFQKNSTIKTHQINDSTTNGLTPTLTELSKTFSFINGIPGARIMLKFLAPMFEFFDDYWYYIYHQDNYSQLQIMPSFLVLMYTINQDRIFPQFLNFPFSLTISEYIQSDFTNYTNNQINKIDKNPTYFLQNIQPMIFQQYPIICIAFIILKFFNQLIQKYYSRYFQQKSQSFKEKSVTQTQIVEKFESESFFLSKLRFYLSQFSCFKSFIMILFSPNIIFISFTFASQLNLMFALNFFDVGNLSFTILQGFAIIIFTIFIFFYAQFYLLPKRFPKNIKSSRKIHSHYQFLEEKRENFYYTFFGHIKCILYGFIHGFFIEYPNLQYCLLSAVKVNLIVLLLIKSSIFNKKVIKICSFFYFVAGIFVDLICFLSKNLMIPEPLTSDSVQDFSITSLFEIFCLVIICLSVIFSVFAQAYSGVCSNFQEYKVKNRVQDEKVTETVNQMTKLKTKIQSLHGSRASNFFEDVQFPNQTVRIQGSNRSPENADSQYFNNKSTKKNLRKIKVFNRHRKGLQTEVRFQSSDQQDLVEKKIEIFQKQRGEKHKMATLQVKACTKLTLTSSSCEQLEEKKFKSIQNECNSLKRKSDSVIEEFSQQDFELIVRNQNLLNDVKKRSTKVKIHRKNISPRSTNHNK